MPRYHAYRGKRRTTVSIDTMVSDFLALHLGHEPGSAEAHAAVRTWLQDEIDRAADPGRGAVSQWLLGRALLALARPDVIEAYGQHVDKMLSTLRPKAVRKRATKHPSRAAA